MLEANQNGEIMVKKADLTQKYIQLEKRYQEEVSKLRYFAEEGISKIGSSPSTRQEECEKWAAQPKQVQGLGRRLEAVLKAVRKPSYYRNCDKANE